MTFNNVELHKHVTQTLLIRFPAGFAFQKASQQAAFAPAPAGAEMQTCNDLLHSTCAKHSVGHSATAHVHFKSYFLNDGPCTQMFSYLRGTNSFLDSIRANPLAREPEVLYDLALVQLQTQMLVWPQILERHHCIANEMQDHLTPVVAKGNDSPFALHSFPGHSCHHSFCVRY